MVHKHPQRKNWAFGEYRNERINTIQYDMIAIFFSPRIFIWLYMLMISASALVPFQKPLFSTLSKKDIVVKLGLLETDLDVEELNTYYHQQEWFSAPMLRFLFVSRY